MRNENITSMNISLTEKLKEHAIERVAEGNYTSMSDYVRDLIRLDMEQANKLSNLRRLVHDGPGSGEAAPRTTG